MQAWLLVATGLNGMPSPPTRSCFQTPDGTPGKSAIRLPNVRQTIPVRMPMADKHVSNMRPIDCPNGQLQAHRLSE
jgi:hypothetical protein